MIEEMIYMSRKRLASNKGEGFSYVHCYIGFIFISKIIAHKLFSYKYVYISRFVR